MSGRVVGAVDGDAADQLAKLVVVGSSGFCAAANREIDMGISSINGRRDPLAIDITQRDFLGSRRRGMRCLLILVELRHITFRADGNIADICTNAGLTRCADFFDSILDQVEILTPVINVCIVTYDRYLDICAEDIVLRGLLRHGGSGVAHNVENNGEGSLRRPGLRAAVVFQSDDLRSVIGGGERMPSIFRIVVLHIRLCVHGNITRGNVTAAINVAHGEGTILEGVCSSGVDTRTGGAAENLHYLIAQQSLDVFSRGLGGLVRLGRRGQVFAATYMDICGGAASCVKRKTKRDSACRCRHILVVDPCILWEVCFVIVNFQFDIQLPAGLVTPYEMRSRGAVFGVIAADIAPVYVFEKLK